MRRALAALFLATPALAQTTLSSTLAHPARQDYPQPTVSALQQTRATLTFRLTTVNPNSGGELFLLLHAAADTPTHPRLTLRIPLSSNQDAYGESRTCTVAGPVFTAGLDEKNFAAFNPSAAATPIDLDVNKYLCRALAVPYHCAGRPLTLPAHWNLWHFEGPATLELTAGAPATVESTPVIMHDTGQPFDPETCARIAPSSGICCVAHRTTAWHCGGTPTGKGWHQVSGDCWHRETGTSCPD